MNRIFELINIYVARRRAHMNATLKIFFNRHPYCLIYHIPLHTSLRAICRQKDSLDSTKPTQLLIALTTLINSNTL